LRIHRSQSYLLADKPRAQITLRTVDTQGVSNLGIKTTFSPLFLNSEPNPNVPVVEPQSGSAAASGMEVASPLKAFPAGFYVSF